MNWPDFTKRSNAIAILLGLDIFFFVAAFTAFRLSNASTELHGMCLDAFKGISGALLLALKVGDTPSLPPGASSSTQTVSTSITGVPDAGTK